MIRFLIILFSFIYLKSVHSQDYGYKNYGLNEGLASNTIYAFAEDQNGYTWIATDSGVSKFNGESFKNYTTIEGLTENEILNIYIDSKNRIWLFGYSGEINFIDNDIVYTSKNSSLLKQIKTENFITTVFENNKNELFLSDKHKNIIKIYGDKVVQFKAPKSKRYLPVFFQDKEKTYLLNYKNDDSGIQFLKSEITTRASDYTKINFDELPIEAINHILKSSVGLLRESNTYWKTLNKNLNIYFNNNYKENTIGKLYDISDQNYWISNLKKGVILYSKSSEKIQSILPKVRSTRIFKDSEKNIFIGTLSNGMYIIPNLNIKSYQLNNKIKSPLNSLYIDDNYNVFIGTENGHVYIADSLLNIKQKINISRDNISEKIRRFKLKDSLYILSDNHLTLINKQFRKINSYDFLCSDENSLRHFKDIVIDNNFIYTAHAKGIYQYDPVQNKKDVIYKERCTSLLLKNDTLFMANSKGIFLYNKEKKRFKNINKDFSNTIIYDLKEFKNSSLLIGSNSKGIGIIKDKTARIIDEKNGLLSNFIRHIEVDKENNIWACTNKGLNLIQLNEDDTVKNIKSWTVNDGLLSNNIKCLKRFKNKLYVLTSKGINIIEINTNWNHTEVFPRVSIDKILVNNVAISVEHDKVLNSFENNIEFNYGAASYKNASYIKYLYRLNGHENEWITTLNPSVRYSSLPPGKYTFEIMPIGKNNKTNQNIIKYNFQIKPPFYKTWWFTTVVLAIFFISIILYIRRIKLKQEKERKINEKITNLKFHALNAQMNPHFINNLLNNISYYIKKGDVKKSIESLQKFSNLVNLVLKATRKDLISLQKELEMCKYYIDLENNRFKESIDYNLNFGNLNKIDLEEIHVPPMILQPIIENAFIHGFSNTGKKNILEISFDLISDEYLVCKVRDNGAGVTTTSKTKRTNGISKKNINERLEIIDSAPFLEQYIEIKHNKSFGTIVIIKIPLLFL